MLSSRRSYAAYLLSTGERRRYIVDTFYIAGRLEWETVKGEWIKFRNYPMFRFFGRKHDGFGGYSISEYYSGCKVGYGINKDSARRNTRRRLNKKDTMIIAKGIIQVVADFGLTPNATPDEFAEYIMEVITCALQSPGSGEKGK
jgi:hypothetical protein